MNLLSGAEKRIPVAGDTQTGYAVYFHLFDGELAGMSVWDNGATELISDSVRWLRGKIALVPSPLFSRGTLPPDSDAHTVNPRRLMEQSGRDAHAAILERNIYLLAVAVIQAYGVQIVMGAPFLTNNDELGKKHCEGDLPGHAFYLFHSQKACRNFANDRTGVYILT